MCFTCKLFMYMLINKCMRTSTHIQRIYKTGGAQKTECVGFFMEMFRFILLDKHHPTLTTTKSIMKLQRYKGWWLLDVLVHLFTVHFLCLSTSTQYHTISIYFPSHCLFGPMIWPSTHCDNWSYKTAEDQDSVNSSTKFWNPKLCHVLSEKF